MFRYYSELLYTTFKSHYTVQYMEIPYITFYEKPFSCESELSDGVDFTCHELINVLHLMIYYNT